MRRILPTPEKYCLSCGGKMERRQFAKALESVKIFLKRKYCCQDCMGKAFQKPVASKSAYHYRAGKFRKKACEECGSTDQLNLHHRDGNNMNNAPENRQTLCASCHTKWHWKQGKKIPERGEKSRFVGGQGTRWIT